MNIFTKSSRYKRDLPLTNRKPNRYLRANSRFALNLKPGSDQLGAFPHPKQAEVPARCEVCWALGYDESTAIVADFQADLVLTEIDVERRAAGFGVAYYIAQCFLSDAV